MGYRSEVAYRIVFTNKQVLNEFVALVMMKGGFEVEALRECEVEILDNGREECYVNYYAQDVKWYDSYPQVAAHTWLYNYAVERFEDDCAYSFIRIGEDSGDIEEEEGGSDDLIDYVRDDFYVTRSIELPFSYDYEPVGDNLRVIEEALQKLDLSVKE